MEGDREKKELLIQTIREDNLRLQQELETLKQRQLENDAENTQMNLEIQKTLESRAEAEASKTRAEREAQEKSKEIMNMERACSLLEQKKLTAGLEEKQIIDKLWDSYGLTPGTAPEHRGEIESVPAGNRRAAELKRKISALGTPNLGAIEEYARVNERYTYLTGQRDDVLGAKKDLEGIIKEITQQMTEIFVAEFAKINEYFGKVFEESVFTAVANLIGVPALATCGVQLTGKAFSESTLLSLAKAVEKEGK